MKRTSSLQSNTLFHAGAFLLPFDGGIRNKFTCYFLKDTEFKGFIKQKYDSLLKYKFQERGC